MTGKPGFLNQLVLKPLPPQVLHKQGPVLPGIPQAEPLHGLVRKFPFLQILVSDCSLGRAELVIEKLRGLLIYRQKPCPPALPFASLLRLVRLRQLHPRTLRQHLYRLGKGIILIVHHKGIYIPSRPASEAMVYLKVAVDGKRGRFLVVERA